MPELPEVETVCRGIRPHVVGQEISRIVVRQPKLRYPVSRRLPGLLVGQTVRQVGRRAKYILLQCEPGTVIIHLGMSGSLRIVAGDEPPGRHDHVDICLASGHCLRYRDPRRFGSIVWAGQKPDNHRLLRVIGPEPFSASLTAAYLYELARGRRSAVKNFIMDSHVIAGVGNIYASEALFYAGIHPARAAGRIALSRYQRLLASIRQVLEAAIDNGGTTLRDFYQADERPGYFKQQLAVYDRAGHACNQCGALIRNLTLGQRASYYCPRCQS